MLETLKKITCPWDLVSKARILLLGTLGPQKCCRFYSLQKKSNGGQDMFQTVHF